jgi:hypothetical protein
MFLDMAFTKDDRNSSLGSFAPMVRLNNSTSTNKRQKNDNVSVALVPTSMSLPPSTAVVVMQQPLQQMLLPHSLTATMNDSSIAGLGYRSWSSLLVQSKALNAVKAEPKITPQHPVVQEQIDNPPPPEEQHLLSSLQRAVLSNDTCDDMEADDHINSATRKADVSDGRFNRKLKAKKNEGGERIID